MNIIRYESKLAQEWDNFISKCPMATFLHSRKFLSYHKERFNDFSLLCYDAATNKLLAVFPAALNPNDEACIVSHPGISYGGILHQGKVLGKEMVDLLDALLHCYSAKGFSTLIYKAIPYIYHHIPSSDDEYALFVHHADLYRKDLSCTINLNNLSYSLSNKDLSKIRNILRKAKKNRVMIVEEKKYLNQFWKIVESHLFKKYQKKPIHHFNEIKNLMELFPDNIKLITALIDDEIVAGAIVFLTNKVVHTQYLVNTEYGMEVFALDYLIQHCINFSKKENYDFFDFGISNENEGKFLNQNLYLFKAKHGGTGMVHNFYKLTLGS